MTLLVIKMFLLNGKKQVESIRQFTLYSCVISGNPETAFYFAA